MGTRNLTCVIKDGKYRVAQYGQWDGYPEGQGMNILNFLKKMDRSLFEKKLDMVSWATEEELNQMWAEAGADLESPFVSMDIAEKHKKLYPENSRDIGSDVLKIIQNTERPLKLKNAIDFAKDSLFCEWAYIINLDDNTLEVYEGFNKTPLTSKDRFFYMQNDEMEYYPVKLVIAFELDNLPKGEEFVEKINEKSRYGVEVNSNC